MVTVQASQHPRYTFEVRYADPLRREANGRPKRVIRYFKNQRAAEQAATRLQRELTTVGTAGVHLDAKARAEYLGARQALDEGGWTELPMIEAVRLFLAGNTKLANRQAPVAPMFEEFIRVKRVDENRSARWVHTLHSRVKNWIDTQAIATVEDITRDRVLPLRSRQGVSARTRLADMTAVSTFLNWLVQEQWLAKNPLDDVPRPATDATTPRVLTAVQVRSLLQAAREQGEGRLLRYFALAIFAGLRPGEIERLTPEHLHLNQKDPVIRVVGGKRRQRVRIVPVLPALKAWLRVAPARWPIAELAGKDRWLFDEVRQAAGLIKWEGVISGPRKQLFSHWQDDICRHTFISLRIAMTQDEGRVALEAGNTPDVIHAHYLSMISAKEAKAILAVKPKTTI